MIESARCIWQKLLKEGYKQVQLTDNKYLHFLIKKIQQWSKFIETILKQSGIKSSDPWMNKDKKSEKQTVKNNQKR